MQKTLPPLELGHGQGIWQLGWLAGWLGWAGLDLPGLVAGLAGLGWWLGWPGRLGWARLVAGQAGLGMAAMGL